MKTDHELRNTKATIDRRRCSSIGVRSVKASIAIFAAAFLICGAKAAADSQDQSAREVIALERKVLDAWQVGNPDAMLAIADPDITYFHAMTEKRVDGLPSLSALFEAYRGRPLFDSYEMAEPKVQVSGDVAVLTYILVRHVGTATTRWNSTQVYQHKTEGWRVIHSHWSVTKSPE